MPAGWPSVGPGPATPVVDSPQVASPHRPTPAAICCATSGSTGPPKGALLSASALHASIAATAERLAMPCVRAATAGTHPAFIASLADILLEAGNRKLVGGQEDQLIDIALELKKKIDANAGV